MHKMNRINYYLLIIITIKMRMKRKKLEKEKGEYATFVINASTFLIDLENTGC